MIATYAAEELKRAIAFAFVGRGGVLAFDAPRSRPWASITFSGERHGFGLCLCGPDARRAMDAFLDGLSEREFALRGHILIDIAVRERSDEADCVRVTLEALTVEES
jgi:hypothetical protein